MDLLANANREKFELLGAQYTENLEAVLALQGTLIDDILPSVTDELELDAESIEWAKEWLSDTCLCQLIFLCIQRNKFTRSFAMESIRKTLVWRFTHLWPPNPPLRLPFVHCLPPPARDPFGRPILVIRVSGAPTLQYVILLDLKNLSTQSLNIDLVTWTLRDAIPKFPGLLAAAFMINYSWTHAGIWSLAKRSVLPATAISRVFFPTQQELADYFSTSMLPKDYGGTLASLTELHDPLWNDLPSPQLGVGSGEPTAEPDSPLSAPSIARIVAEAAAPSITAIPATKASLVYSVLEGS
ncbi:hypothetical protein B0H14DRAFT_2709458 [Mycena olivaceomarginata]|nr:hypothetical protein B0H14DRAFT_2709458 [Mycena olivaceomarginata]